MANITFGDHLGDFGQLTSFYSGALEFDSMTRVKNKIVEVTYIDSETGAVIELHGDNLKFTPPDKHHLQHHVLAGGTVTSVIFTSAAGEEQNDHGDLMAIDDAQFNAAYLYRIGHKHIGDLAGAVLAGNDKIDGTSVGDYMLGGDGNDTIKGMAGADWLTGNGGNDHLIGGKDGDVFWFGKGQDKDTVEDYQPGLDQIGLLTTDRLYSWQKGHDLVLQFVAHVEHPDAHHPPEHAPDTMTIKGVHIEDISFYSL